MEGIHLVVFPQPCIDLVFLSKKRSEIYENGNRIARYIPAADLHFQSLLSSFSFPIRIQVCILGEIRTVLLAPAVGTNEDNPVVHHLLKRLSSC